MARRQFTIAMIGSVPERSSGAFDQELLAIGRYAKSTTAAVESPKEAMMWSMGLFVALAIVTGDANAPTGMKDLVFLTRDSCVNTPDMVNNLDDALHVLRLPNDYQFINIGKLSSKDVRTGFPTPTVLWKGKDIFGMPTPKPPYDVPS